MGNCDEARGDGWLRRGAGFGQLTSTDNERAAAVRYGIARDQIGDWLRTSVGTCLVSGNYLGTTGQDS